MAKTATYSLISSQTLGSSGAVTFSSIPQTFTDLVLVCSVQSASGPSSNSVRCNLQFNSDTATNYSTTRVISNNVNTVGSSRDSTRSQIDEATHISSFGTGEFCTFIFNIMDYANTTTYKSLLQRSGNTTNIEYKEVGAAASLWRSTAAISTIYIRGGGGNATVGFAAGSTFKLYGIEAYK
jgi:hypothetical protein